MMMAVVISKAVKILIAVNYFYNNLGQFKKRLYFKTSSSDEY